MRRPTTAGGSIRELSPFLTLRAAHFPFYIARCAPEYPMPKERQARAWASGYSGSRTPWAWVKGGKERDRAFTLAGLALLACVTAEGIPATYVNARFLTDRISPRSAYTIGGRRAAEHYRTCPLLLINDVGAESAASNGLRAISDVIAARHRDALPTVIASEHGPTGWLSIYEDSSDGTARDVAANVMHALCGFPAHEISREESALMLSRNLFDFGAAINE